MLNIVMTGGNGFLLGNYIKDYNHNFIAPKSTEVNWVTGKGIDTLPDKPDVFIHSAAIYGGLPFNQNNPKRVLLDNTKMSVNVFEYIFKAKPKKVAKAAPKKAAAKKPVAKKRGRPAGTKNKK